MLRAYGCLWTTPMKMQVTTTLLIIASINLMCTTALSLPFSCSLQLIGVLGPLGAWFHLLGKLLYTLILLFQIHATHHIGQCVFGGSIDTLIAHCLRPIYMYVTENMIINFMPQNRSAVFYYYYYYYYYYYCFTANS